MKLLQWIYESGSLNKIFMRKIVNISYPSVLTFVLGAQKNYGSMNQVQINKIFVHKIVNIFLPISFNICFGCSKEPSH